MTDYNTLETVIADALAKLEYDNNEAARLVVEELKVEAKEIVGDIEAKDGVTAYGANYFNDAKTVALGNIDAIATLNAEEAQVIIDEIIASVESAKATVDESFALTFEGNEAVSVRYGDLIENHVAGKNLVHKNEATGFSYAKSWNYTAGAVVTAETTVSANYLVTGNDLEGENDSLTKSLSASNLNCDDELLYTQVVGDATKGVFVISGDVTLASSTTVEADKNSARAHGAGITIR
jgi:polyhydroxyalkanoate synthesis regulator phasin